MLEQQKQKQENICPICKREMESIIVVKNQRLFKIGDHWEAITNDSLLNFYCPHCHSEIDISKLKTKKVIF
jgi:ribosomal protein L37AE/L43A